MGFGKDSGNESSFTRAGISGYAGDMAVRTGDVQSGIPKIFDVDKVQREIDAQVTITRAFGQVAPKAVADFADRATKRHTQAKLAKDEIDRQLANETDAVRRTELEQARDQLNEIVAQTQGDYDKWREGGIYRAALHTALGGLAGGYTGALGASVVSTAAPGLDQLQDRLEGSLVNAGLQDKTASGIARFITGATAAGLGGALTGGDIAGAGQAFNVDSNNRQLHEEELQRIKKLAKGDQAKEARLTDAACALVRCYAQYREGSELYLESKASADRGGSAELAAEPNLLAKQQELFTYTTDVYNPFNDERIDTFRQFISPRTSAEIAASSAFENGVARFASLNMFGGITDNGYTDLAAQFPAVLPDYYSLSIPTPIPFVGATGTIDRYGQTYGGLGVGVGFPDAGLQVGYLLPPAPNDTLSSRTSPPSREEVSGFLTGPGGSFGVVVGMSVNLPNEPSGGRTAFTVQTPGLGVGYTFGPFFSKDSEDERAQKDKDPQ